MSAEIPENGVENTEDIPWLNEDEREGWLF